MKKNQKISSIKLIEKFDSQLRDILTAELRSVRYSRDKMMDQFIFQHSNNLIAVAL